MDTSTPARRAEAVRGRWRHEVRARPARPPGSRGKPMRRRWGTVRRRRAHCSRMVQVSWPPPRTEGHGERGPRPALPPVGTPGGPRQANPAAAASSNGRRWTSRCGRSTPASWSARTAAGARSPARRPSRATPPAPLRRGRRATRGRRHASRARHRTVTHTHSSSRHPAWRKQQLSTTPPAPAGRQRMTGLRCSPEPLRPEHGSLAAFKPAHTLTVPGGR